jgi:hypothetical protein
MATSLDRSLSCTSHLLPFTMSDESDFAPVNDPMDAPVQNAPATTAPTKRRSPGMAGALITSTFTLAGMLSLVLIIAYGLWHRQGPSPHFRGIFTFGLFLAAATLLMLLLAALYRPLRRMRRLRAHQQMMQNTQKQQVA